MAERPFDNAVGRYRRWTEIAARPDADIDLAEAALEIAAAEYPGLDVLHYLGRIDQLAAVLRQRLRRDIATTDTILALNHYLFAELGFAGNTADYYDPRNSFLNEVLERRIGIPITLSIVYLELGQRLGLAMRGVSFPGHFLVRCPVRDGAILLDPYAGGTSLGLDELRQRLNAAAGGEIEVGEAHLHRLLAPAGKREILSRMLRNLKGIYRERGDLERALTASDRIIVLDPRAADEYRDRGAIYRDLECFRAALEDYRQYLVLRPNAEDAERVKARVAELEGLAARLN